MSRKQRSDITPPPGEDRTVDNPVVTPTAPDVQPSDTPEPAARNPTSSPLQPDERPAPRDAETGDDHGANVLGDQKLGDPKMATERNLLDYWGEDEGDRPPALGLVRLDANEQALAPFTSEFATARLHYCDDPEIKGYVRCNAGSDGGCVLCRAGRNVDERVLLPVYLPAVGSIGVLPISPSSRPGALRPQIMAALRSGRRLVLLVRKPDRTTYTVSILELQDGMDDGAAVVAEFRKRWDAGEVDLLAVYPKFDNRELAAIPGIARMLKIKGVNLDDLG
jgi:hypothetical protein